MLIMTAGGITIGMMPVLFVPRVLSTLLATSGLDLQGPMCGTLLKCSEKVFEKSRITGLRLTPQRPKVLWGAAILALARVR